MEDTIIIKTHYAYMLRADLPPVKSDTNVVLKDNLGLWIESSGCSFYLGTEEEGAMTGKRHYQMIVWFENKLSTREMTKHRNWWRGKCGTHRNNHAFTSARKVLNLSSYCTKDTDKLITNLSPGQLSLVPKWKNKKALKENNKEKFRRLLAEKLETFRKTCITQHGIDSESQYGDSPWDPYRKGNPDYEKFCEIFDIAHIEVYDEPCSYRNKYFKAAKRHGIISVREYHVKIGVISL